MLYVSAAAEQQSLGMIGYPIWPPSTSLESNSLADGDPDLALLDPAWRRVLVAHGERIPAVVAGQHDVGIASDRAFIYGRAIAIISDRPATIEAELAPVWGMQRSLADSGLIWKSYPSSAEVQIADVVDNRHCRGKFTMNDLVSSLVAGESVRVAVRCHNTSIAARRDMLTLAVLGNRTSQPWRVGKSASMHCSPPR